MFRKSAALDYSKITPYLYVGRLPNKKDLDLLEKLQIGLVINMRFDKRVNTQARFQNLWLPAIDTRFTPVPVSKLNRGVTAAQEMIQQHKAVYVNCKLGRHRSVIMAACILIAEGYDALFAIRLIQSKRPSADFAKYIEKQILRYEMTRKFIHAKQDW